MFWALAMLGLLPAAMSLMDFDEDTDQDEDQGLEDQNSNTAVYGEDVFSGILNAIADTDMISNIGAPDGEQEIVVLPDDPDAPIETAAAEGVVILPTYILTPEVQTIEEQVLTSDADTLVLEDDPMEGGKEATLTFGTDGMPVLSTDSVLQVVKAGEGGDQIFGGDHAAILMGEGGNDVLYAGEGTTIASGGEGDDLLFAGTDAGSKYVLSGDEGSDILIGNVGDDTLILDRNDHAHGAGGADEFWLYLDDTAGDGLLQIHDYTAGEDVLRITVEIPAGGDMSITPSFVPTADGTSTLVYVSGEAVAVLNDVTSVDPNDVVFEAVAA